MKNLASARVKSFLICICAALAAFALSNRLSAQITYIGHFKVTTYVQTQPTPPTSPSGYYCGISLNSDPDFAISLPMVSTPSESNPEFIMNENGPENFGYGSPSYTNKVTFDGDYPNGLYDYFVDWPDTNNVLQDEDVYVQFPDTDIYSATIPAFTPDVFNAFNAVDPSQDFALSWIGYAPAPGADFAHTFLGTYDTQTYDSRYGGFNFDCDPDILATIIPAGSLDYGRTYALGMYYSDRKSPALYNSDGSPIFVIIGFDNLVTAYVTTIPPNLQIASADTGAKVKLTWPALASNNYQLQTTRDLSVGNWCNVTNTPMINGSTNTLCLPACHTAAFFRLAPLSL